MPRKKVDNRIRVLVENGIALKQRSLFVVVGDKGREQVVILHHMLCKGQVKARPSVLWCYKKELGFSSHRKKRMRQLQKKLKTGTLDLEKSDPFALFVAATNIRYCYYTETHKILGNTFGMCVLQDFEALTPNLLARTVETVEGGGLIVLLLRSMASLKQLYTLSMDVHARYRTEAHHDVVGRFNERFLLSLSGCSQCMVIDDQLNILPISSHVLNIQPVPTKTEEELMTSLELELRALKESLSDTQPVGSIITCAKTLDQAKAVLKFIEAVSEKTLRSTVTLTAARGRGKSAALGLAIASAVAFGYSNIFVTSPSPENLKTLFEFLFKGFDSLEYTEHDDYEIIQSTNPEFNKAVVRVNIFHEHRQTVQYIHPADSQKLDQAELVCIDEAAAIPLPLVKELLGPYLVFMASTINGYEGTGRSLSLKLIEQLRQQSVNLGETAGGRVLREVTLSEPIRYASGDAVERWLYDLLCLDSGTIRRVSVGCPPPKDCELYCVNRDTLFCYHSASEEFLHRIMALYVASHYKNTPNDLQLLSDAPAHLIFVLLGPIDPTSTTLPDVLCVLQVCLEGEISKSSVMKSLSRGKRASGDLIPWTISQQFADHDFAGLSGVRVVRIATHPDFQGMGYGSRALQLLEDYYMGRVPCLSEVETIVKPVRELETIVKPVRELETIVKPVRGLETIVKPVRGLENDGGGLLMETIAPRTELPPLLAKLSERPPEAVDYLGVAYGITSQLYRFWKRAGYVPIYIRQTPNELTGEHSCIMLKALHTDHGSEHWIHEYYRDFRCRFLSLLGYQFRSFSPSNALSIIHSTRLGTRADKAVLTPAKLHDQFSRYDVKRLDLYSRNMADHHLITDLLPALARVYYMEETNFNLTAAQSAILLGLGLQHKQVEQLELDLPVSQILGLFNRMIRKFVQFFSSLEEQEVGVATPSGVDLKPIEESVDHELSKAAAEFQREQSKRREELESVDLSQYAVAGTEWDDTAGDGDPGIVSVARKKGQKRRTSDDSGGGSSGHKHRRTKKHKH